MKNECCTYVGCIRNREAGKPLAHQRFMIWLHWNRFVLKIQKWFYELGALDYSQIEDIEIDGIDYRDAPDFVDAFITSATYKGRDMTERELERLNNDSDFVYEAVQNKIY